MDNKNNLKIIKGNKSKHLETWKSWLTSDYVMKGFDYRPQNLDELDKWFDQIDIFFLELDGVPVGMVDVYKSDFDSKVFEIGYLVLEDYSGRGYAQKLVGHIIEVAKQKNIHTIIAYTVKDNKASQKILSKNGFKFFEEKQIDGWNFYDKPQPWYWFKLDL